MYFLLNHCALIEIVTATMSPKKTHAKSRSVEKEVRSKENDKEEEEEEIEEEEVDEEEDEKGETKKDDADENGSAFGSSEEDDEVDKKKTKKESKDKTSESGDTSPAVITTDKRSMRKRSAVQNGHDEEESGDEAENPPKKKGKTSTRKSKPATPAKTSNVNVRRSGRVTKPVERLADQDYFGLSDSSYSTQSRDRRSIPKKTPQRPTRNSFAGDGELQRVIKSVTLAIGDLACEVAQLRKELSNRERR